MKNKKIITIILILIWMCIVFKFSSQPSTESSQLSGKITGIAIVLIIKKVIKRGKR